MNTTAANLKNIATGQVAVPPGNTIAHMMQKPAVLAQIKAALPKHMTPERMARIALTLFRQTPKLQECDPMSFLGAVIQCAQLGLEPGGALGHVYILPFEKRKKIGNDWKTVSVEAQVIVGYRGMIDLARRSGQVDSIEARGVFHGDTFDCAFGLDSNIIHIPDWANVSRTHPDALKLVYAVAKLKGGGRQFDVMSRFEIDAIRGRSRNGGSADSPWATDYVAMAQKTVVRRLFKFLPVSIEMQRAISLDERAEADLPQDLATVIEYPEVALQIEGHVVDKTPPEQHERQHEPAGDGAAA